MRFEVSAAGNTMAPCWLALEEMGYVISVDRTDDAEVWIADGNDRRLSASDPCGLLGLAKLVELRGENWRASDEQVADFLHRFMRAG